MTLPGPETTGVVAAPGSATLGEPFPDARAHGLLRLFPALAEGPFRVFWLGMTPATLAIQMGSVATGFAAFALSGSAAVLGGVSLAIGLPMLALSLVGGVVADRTSRRLILVGTQTVLGLSAAAVAVMAFSGQLAVWHLYLFGTAQGVAFAFNMPARQAYLAELVEPHRLRSAMTLNNTTLNFARIAGPALAGILLSIPALGVGGVFAGMATMYGLVILLLLRLPERRVRRAAGGPSGWTQLADGLAYIRGSPTIRGLLILGFIPIFLGFPFQSLLPVFAERVYDVGPGGLGAMNAAVGVGSLAGAIAVAVASESRRINQIQIALGIGFGLSLIGFALSPTYLLALGMLAVVGLASAGYSALNQTLVLEATEPRFHGRVMSVYLLTYGSVPLATFPEAWLADQIGAPAALVGAGAIVALGVLLMAAVAPALRRVEQRVP